MSARKFFLLAAFAVGLGAADAQTRISLRQLQQSANKAGTEGGKARQVGVTDANGNQKYEAFTNVRVTPITYTPSPTGNTIDLSCFVERHDSVWYIDYQGDAKLLSRGGGGGGGGDYDWLRIRDNAIPTAITDTIYKLKKAAIGGRNFLPDVELTVYDSTSVNGSTIAAIGNRGGRVGTQNTVVSGAWTTYGQEGTVANIYCGPATPQLTIGSAGGTVGAPGAPLESWLTIQDSTFKLWDFTSSRNDPGTPTALYSPNSDGTLRVDPLSEISIPAPLTATQVGYGAPGNTVTGEAAFSYDATANKLAVDSISGRHITLTETNGVAEATIHLKGNHGIFQIIDPDSRTTKDPGFGFGRSLSPSFSSAGDDMVYTFGLNNSGQTTLRDGSKAGMFISMESNFQNSITAPKAFEFHVPQVVYPGAVVRRPISGVYSNDAADLRGSTDFVSDKFIISDYVTNTARIFWGIATNSGYDKGITFADTSRIFFGKNGKQGGGMFQRNGAGTAYMGLLYAAPDNYAVVGDDGAGVRIFPGNLEIGSTGEIFPTNGFLYLGKTGTPADVRILSFSTEALSLTASAQPTRTWKHLVNSDNYAINSPAGTVCQFYDSAPFFSGANNRLSIGGFGNSRFSVLQAADNSEGGMGLFSSGGTPMRWWLDGSSNLKHTNGSYVDLSILYQNGDMDYLRTGALKLHSGTAAQRPTVGAGKVRHNSTTGNFEGSRDGSTWENFLMGSGTGAAFQQGGNAFGATAVLGTTDNQPQTFITNNVERARLSQVGQFQLNNYTSASAFTGTTDHFNTQSSSGQLLTKSAAQFVGELGTAVRYPVTRQPVADGVPVPGAGLIATGLYRVPALYNGYSFYGVSYQVQTAGTGGQVDIRVKKAGTGVHFGTLTAGSTQLDVSGTGIIVSTGDLLQVEISGNSSTVSPTALWVTYFFAPN